MTAVPRTSVEPDGRLRVSGDLTFDTVPHLLETSARDVQSGADELTIDLAGVQRSDSAGLALLVEWMRLARAAGRPLRFANMPAQLRSIIRVNGLSETLGTNDAS